MIARLFALWLPAIAQLAAVLDDRADIAIVGQANDGQEVIEVISENVVCFSVNNLLRKLDARDHTATVVTTLRSGLVKF